MFSFRCEEGKIMESGRFEYTAVKRSWAFWLNFVFCWIFLLGWQHSDEVLITSGRLLLERKFEDDVDKRERQRAEGRNWQQPQNLFYVWGKLRKILIELDCRKAFQIHADFWPAVQYLNRRLLVAVPLFVKILKYVYIDVYVLFLWICKKLFNWQITRRRTDKECKYYITFIAHLFTKCAMPFLGIFACSSYSFL